MAISCVVVLLAVIVGANKAEECLLSDWGEWTEWTRLDCGEVPSGAEAPVRGKYQPHLANYRTPSTMEEGRLFCNQGLAGQWPCANVDQMASFTLEDLCGKDDCGHKKDELIGKDVYGWVGPDGHEYGIMTINFGTTFVRLSADVNNITLIDPEVLAYMEGTNGEEAVERDVIVIGDYAFIVANTTDHGMQIFNLTQLVDITEAYPEFPLTILNPTATYTGFGRSRRLIGGASPNDLFVAGAEDGVLTCDGGLMALDISDPLSPAYMGCYGDNGMIYNGHCIEYSGRDDDYSFNGTNTEVCILFNGLRMIIVNVDDKSNMQLISINDYQGREFASQGWTENRHIILLSGDEEDELTNPTDKRTRTYIWDMVNLDAPFRDFTFTAEYMAIDGEQFEAWGRVYQANYEAGLHILRIDQALETLQELGSFDAFLDDPQDDRVEFAGIRGVFPFFVGPLNNGNVLLASIEEGLFVVRPDIITMTEMVEKKTLISERYRYRDVLSVGDDPSLCPTTVDVETRQVKMPELC